MRSQSDFSASESHGISSRAWLYAGALAVGFWVASMADFDTVQPAEAGNNPSPAGDAVVATDEGGRSMVSTHEARSTVRTVVIESSTPRIGARTP